MSASSVAITVDVVGQIFQRRATFLRQDHTEKQYTDFLESECVILADQIRQMDATLQATIAKRDEALEPRTGAGYRLDE